MSHKKLPIRRLGVRVKPYQVMARAIEDGIQRGWRIGYKHTANATPDYVMEQIENAVWHEINEYFNFDDEES